MIIPGDAVLSLCIPPPELQGPRDQDSDFGQLLTEAEAQTTFPPSQEAEERRVFETMLQVLMTIFQSFTPSHPAPAGSASRAGESGVVNIQPAGGPGLGLPCGLGSTPGLGETREINLPRGLAIDALPDIEQPACPALDSQRLEPPSATAILQESMQDVHEFFMIYPTVIMTERPSDTGAIADHVLPHVAANPALPRWPPQPLARETGSL